MTRTQGHYFYGHFSKNVVKIIVIFIIHCQYKFQRESVIYGYETLQFVDTKGSDRI